MPTEAGAVAGTPEAAAAAAPSAEVLEHGPLGRAFGALGNALFYTTLGGAAFLGYYHYKYDADQLEHMIEETAKVENQFPGSQVSTLQWFPELNRIIVLFPVI